MEKIYVSENAPDAVFRMVIEAGCEPYAVKEEYRLPAPVASHADLMMCRLGIAPSAEVFVGDRNKLGSEYPSDARYDAACTGKYIICRSDITDPGLISAATSSGMKLIDVKQGYAKCNIVIVDEVSIITSDRGISAACENEGLDVLTVSSGHVELKGYDHGFIGGASGRIGGRVIFCGDLSDHPDFAAIKAFIEARGAECVWTEEFPLTDIGSLV